MGNNKGKINKDLIHIIYKIIKKYKSINFKKSINNNDVYINPKNNFKKLIKLRYNYPEYPNHKYGKNLLIYIREYLISKTINIRRPIYPDYIINTFNNSETEKRKFRNISNNYEIDKDYNLYIKYYNNKDNNSNANYNLLKVPLVKNINNFIYDLHKQIGHRNSNSVRIELIKRNFYFKGVISVIKNICNECQICHMKQNIALKKRENSKIIIFSRPRYRYIGDLTDIPHELRKNTKYLYMFNIIDHFSKYAQSYLLFNKEAKSILDKLKEFIDENGIPYQFGSDNGREFINNSVKKYLCDLNVHMVNGAPYHPRSQGVVERIHITFRKALLSKYLDSPKDFNLEKDIIKIVNTYNKSIHSITKYCPIEIFFNTDNTIFRKVYDNTLNYYIKTQKDSITYKIGEKCFLDNNIIITNKKLEKKFSIIEHNKIKKNKNFIKQIVEIIKVYESSFYLIKIIENFNNDLLKKNEKYGVNFKLLKKGDDILISKLLNSSEHIVNLAHESIDENINISEESISKEDLENNELNDSELNVLSEKFDKLNIRSNSI